MPGRIRSWLAVGLAGVLAATLMLTGCSDDSADHAATPAVTPSTPPVTLTPTPSPTPTKPPDPWAHRRTYTIAFLGGDGGPTGRAVGPAAWSLRLAVRRSGTRTLMALRPI